MSIKDILDHVINKGGKLHYKCRFCSATEIAQSKNLKGWDRVTMHFADGEIDVLLCSECKKINPHEMLKRIMEKTI